MSALLRHARVLSWLAVGLWVTAGCGGGQRDPGVGETRPGSSGERVAADPGEAFADLEHRLLQGRASRIAFRITADGAFSTALEGELILGVGNDVALRSEGTFGSDSVSLSLDVADGRMIGGNGDRGFEEPVPAGLREAVVIGLTRMGLLHNLARLVTASPPDRADGGVREWVQARAFDWTVQRNAARGGRGISFEVWVAEQPAAEAALWLDARRWPVARDQTVRFPGGEMRVREEYEFR